MKITINFEEKIKTFPKLMILKRDLPTDTPKIVLFLSDSQGVILQTNPKKDWEKVGDYDNSFDIKQFEEFTGTITLQND